MCKRVVVVVTEIERSCGSLDIRRVFWMGKRILEMLTRRIGCSFLDERVPDWDEARRMFQMMVLFHPPIQM